MQQEKVVDLDQGGVRIVRRSVAQFLDLTPIPDTSSISTGDRCAVVLRGINAIPAAILLDKDGKVVSMAARGDELSKQLEKLLGKAE